MTATKLVAIFNRKANQFVQGRKGILDKIASDFANAGNIKTAWFHCASLGEFEQGRPVIESFREHFPDHKILLTFFSPSGYEVRKNYDGVDFVYYMPLDSKKNAEKFIASTNPTIAFFVKYEFWHYYIDTLYQKQIPVISISSIFRRNQAFFKFYGSFNRKTLFKITRFFVQNQDSVSLLKNIGIQDAVVSGDTRFDRVTGLSHNVKEIPAVMEFKGNSKLMVIGSSWTADMQVLIPFINQEKGLKFIIAPHEINYAAIEKMKAGIERQTLLYSETNQGNPTNAEVLIIDNVGMLSSLYQYGDFAYIGGAFGAGLHNILEAATFGMPIFFGNRNYRKFQEANDLIALKGAFAIGSYPGLKSKFELISDKPTYKKTCKITSKYVRDNIGATEKIMEYCLSTLKQPWKV